MIYRIFFRILPRDLQVKQVSAAPGTVFEVAEQAGDWLRVLMGDAPSAWMSSSAQGMPLLAPARRHEFVMDPAVRAGFILLFLPRWYTLLDSVFLLLLKKTPSI